MPLSVGMSDTTPQAAPRSPSKRFTVAGVVRTVTAVVLLAGLVAYLFATIVLGLPPSRRIDLIGVILIAVVGLACIVLLQPALFERVRLLEMKGFRLELLEKVREQQLRQAHELDDLRLIIPILFPEAERIHLRNLAQGKPAPYRGSETVRSELRRLRGAGLIRMHGNRYIGDLKDDLVADLPDFVELTEFGIRWARRLAELDESGREPAKKAI